MAVKYDGTIYTPEQGLKGEALLEEGVKDTYNFGPILIKDGQAQPAWSETAKYYPRTAVGMVKPGIYVLLVTDTGSYAGLNLSLIHIWGLGKKVLLANSFARVVDEIFKYGPYAVSRKALWLGAILYMMQIYYDFSGYSDMAIGLGKMFGFEFQENFNYPYTCLLYTSSPFCNKLGNENGRH